MNSEDSSANNNTSAVNSEQQYKNTKSLSNSLFPTSPWSGWSVCFAHLSVCNLCCKNFMPESHHTWYGSDTQRWKYIFYEGQFRPSDSVLSGFGIFIRICTQKIIFSFCIRIFLLSEIVPSHRTWLGNLFHARVFLSSWTFISGSDRTWYAILEWAQKITTDEHD